jgi:hypothetical protein
MAAALRPGVAVRAIRDSADAFSPLKQSVLVTVIIVWDIGKVRARPGIGL